MTRRNALWLAALTLLTAMAWAQPRKSRLSDAEKKWLRMIDPIITYDERREFRRLKTLRDRQLFVEKFWAMRDSDLTDNVNPFRSEYLARYDYAMANFEKANSVIPRDQRSLIWIMLGKPDRIEKRIDYTIMGFRFRNRYLQHQPEVWTYEDPGYEYKRNKLKFQLAPTSVFGDFVAFSDNYASVWFDQLKYRMIVNPDIEAAPLEALASDDFQDGTGLSGSARDAGRPAIVADQPVQVETSPEPMAEEEPAPANEGETSVAEPAPKVEPEPEPRSEVEAKPVAEPVESPPEAVASAEPPVETDPAPSPEPIRETPLATPSPLSADRAADDDGDPYLFRENTGNELRLAGKLSYFKSGADRGLLLGRVGFPLNSLTFDFERGQYTAPFEMSYALFDDDNEVLLRDRVESEVSVPNDRALKSNKHYGRDLALALPSGRYTLKAQLKDLASGSVSFVTSQVDIPPLGEDAIQVSDLALMDRNVDPATAKFRIREMPHALRLSNVFSPRDRLRPVIEIMNNPSQNELDSIGFTLYQDGERVQSWTLYPEEMSATNQGTILVHPELRMSVFGPGPYRLRFEMKLDNGETAARETAFVIANKKK